jgi:hypothetical protein
MPPQSTKLMNQATNHLPMVVMVEVSHSLKSFPKLVVDDDGENCYRKFGSHLCLSRMRLQMIFLILHALLQEDAGTAPEIPLDIEDESELEWFDDSDILTASLYFITVMAIYRGYMTTRLCSFPKILAFEVKIGYYF